MHFIGCQASCPTCTSFRLETVAKKWTVQKLHYYQKNPQFLPNQADIQAILPNHELDIFTKFNNNWIDIMASPLFFQTVSTRHEVVQLVYSFENVSFINIKSHFSYCTNKDLFCRYI